MNALHLLILFVNFFTIINTLILPSFIEPCSISDKNINQCIQTVAQGALKKFSKGMPELDVPSMDPAKLDLITINIPGLKVVYNNTILTGVGDGRIENLKINLNKYILKFEYIGNVTLHGKYTARGRVLILPVVGDGDYTNIIKNMRIKIKYNFKRVKNSEGIEHWTSNLAKRSFTVEGAYFDFKNLFGGNKFLAETTLRFLNENWESIMNDIAPTAVDQIVGVCTDAANKFYEKFPADILLRP